MSEKKKILAINGSATSGSSNQSILQFIGSHLGNQVEFEVWEDLSNIPHFDTALTNINTPAIVTEFRSEVEKADGVIICTPEYVFSIPSRLKNMIEWCVSTVIFTDKPVALVTASASGEKGHAELQLLMKTLGASFTEETTLLIQGVKGKVDKEGNITHEQTKNSIMRLAKLFLKDPLG